MGVDLGQLVACETLQLRELDGKVVYVDGNNVLYQFLSIIRQPDGTPLKDRQGRVTSHLAGLLYRTANVVEAGILPVFVWDGKPDERKMDVLVERRRRREEAAEAAEKAREEGDLETARTKATQSAKLTREMIEQADELLGHLGIPTVRAPSEGEAQAAAAVREGKGHASVSQDYDSLLFGSPRLVRNLNATGRRKLPGRDQYVEVRPERIVLDEVLASLELTHEELVGVGVLIGTDYHPGIKGVGPKRALKAIKEHVTLEAAAEALGGDVDELLLVAEIFLEPDVEGVDDPAWRAPDRAAVQGMLVDGFGFSQDRVASTLDRYKRLESPGRQGSLSDFF